MHTLNYHIREKRTVTAWIVIAIVAISASTITSLHAYRMFYGKKLAPPMVPVTTARAAPMTGLLAFEITFDTDPGFTIGPGITTNILPEDNYRAPGTLKLEKTPTRLTFLPTATAAAPLTATPQTTRP